MRKFLTIVPLIALIAACSDKASFENQGQQAGAAADQVIESASNRAAATQDKFNNVAANVSEKTRSVQNEVEGRLSKVGNAVDAAEAELKK